MKKKSTSSGFSFETSEDYKLLIAVVDLLLKNGADFNVVAKDGSTASHIITSNFCMLSNYIIQHANSDSINSIDSEGNTPLCLAILRKSVPLFKSIASVKGVDLNIRTSDNCTLLMRLLKFYSDYNQSSFDPNQNKYSLHSFSSTVVVLYHYPFWNVSDQEQLEQPTIRSSDYTINTVCKKKKALKNFFFYFFFFFFF